MGVVLRMSRVTADVNVNFHPCSKAVGKRHRREHFQPLTTNDDVSVLAKHSRTGLLFVCLIRVFRTTRELFTYFHHYLWRATDFDLYSALMAIEKWRSFNVPHLLWHGPTLYNSHLWGPVTLTPLPSVWQWSCHYLFQRFRYVPTGNRTVVSHIQGERSTTTPPRRSTCT